MLLWMQKPPTPQTIEAACQTAHETAELVKKVRKRWARRYAAATRIEHLQEAFDACAAAAAPLRSYIFRALWHEAKLEDELAMRAAIAALGKERHLLYKMLRK
jgi:hypothetical protein